MCTDLLIGAVYETDPGIDAKEVERKIEQFKIKNIPPAYWQNALSALDDNLSSQLKNGSLSWDELIGCVMVWKLAKVEGI